MGKRAFRRAALLTTILQVGSVLVEMEFPSLQRQNLYPIVGVLLAGAAGFLFALWSPGKPIKVGLVGGALAGGVSSFLGTLFAALLGQASPSPAVEVLVATVTGIVAGAVGGFIGRLFAGTPASA